MGEIKSVKVDNWGVFFLQKLQNFFNKTDYCDLTLQFRDNSQLKVHRLVLSACTDYFNVLEQTCEVVDDAIIMPNGLQADVVVPIVNFMYTGTLEFELKMYNRLLRTAKDMNMTVLLKLLEAHRRTMEMHPQKNQAPSSPKTKRKIIPSYAAGSGTQTNVGGRTLVQPTAKRIIVSGNNPPQQHRMGASSNTYPRSATGNVVSGTVPVKQQIGSTTFTRIKQEAEHEGGYTLSKKSVPQQATPSSPFEQLRKGYTNNNKRPPTATFVSPPAKKPNIEDVKEFAEQQRMRKQIAAEFGDDGDYDAGIMDDDTIHNDDDDDDMATTTMPSPQQAQQHKNTSTAVQTSSTQQQQTEDPPGTTTIIVKNEGPDKPPTIVVKDSSNSKMNHAKIISEVLRQYPHLVNSNKNIKLKIMPNAGGQSQKVIVKKEPTTESDNANAPTVAPQQTKIAIGAKSDPKAASAVQPKPKQQTGNATSVTSSVDQTTNKTADSTTGSAAAVAPQAAPAQKRRIDSKTMHALIALGAENTTGPWLCLRCGRNGHPISIPSYRGFRRHLINTHKETIDPALCEHCGWRSSSKRELHFHMQLEHKIRTNLYIFPECQLCQQMCIDSDALNQHLIDSHPDENKQQCIYCNKIFPEELQLYTHMKTFHKKQALEDGIIDYSDDENVNAPSVFPPPNEDEEMLMEEEIDAQQDSEKKVKILSDISLPIASSIMKTDSFASENVTAGESTTSAASEEYLQEQGGEHMETKFVAADGSEVILTDEQRKEILSQLNQEHDGSGVVMVLNENQQLTTTAETQSEQGAISHDETSQATTATTNDDPEQDDSHIYSEIKSQTSEAVHEDEEEDTVSQPPEEDIHGTEEQQKPKGGKVHHDQQMEESKESIDDLEWAENLISEHEMAEHTSESPKPEISTTTAEEKIHKEDKKPKQEDNTEDDISRKLKELAGEWSEDEDLDEEMEEKMPEEKMEEECLDDDVNKVVDEVPETAAPAEEDKQLVDEDIETTNVESNEIENEDKEKDKDEEVAEGEEVKESETKIEDDNIAMEEDDVDLALKNLHKEGDDGVKAEEEAINESSEKANEPKTVEDVIGNIAELEKVTEEDKETEVDDTDKDRIPTEEDKVTTTSTNDEASKKEDTEATETAPDATVVSNIDEEEKSSVTVKEEKNTADCSTDKISEDEPPVEDEFLAISPEKTKNLSPDESAASTTAEKEPDAQTTSTKTDPNPISSEERVKSLISEWGDDDDEEENETNIATPSL